MSGGQPRPVAPHTGQLGWTQGYQHAGTPSATGSPFASYSNPAAAGVVGFNQRSATVGFAAPHGAQVQQHHQWQQHNQHQQQFAAGAGFTPPPQQHQAFAAQFQAQRQLFGSGFGSGSGDGDGFASMDCIDEPWLAQFAPPDGQQFATFQRHHQAAAVGTAGPQDPRAVAFLTTMRQKGCTVPVQKAMALAGNDVNKAAVLLNVAVKRLGSVQKMKGGTYRTTVTTAVQAHGGCFVAAWAQIEQAYKLIAAVQRMQGGAPIASKAIAMASNNLVHAAHVLQQYAAQSSAR